MSSYTCIPVNLEKIFLRSSGLCKSFHCDQMMPFCLSMNVGPIVLSLNFWKMRNNNHTFPCIRTERRKGGGLKMAVFN